MATDEELVVAFVGGDRRALAAVHDHYADRVHDLCVSLTDSSAAAADAYDNVFLVAARRLEGLRQPPRLRTWLYAITRSECRSRSAVRSPSELSTLLDEAHSRLDGRHREVLDLHLRHGLEDDEVAGVLELSTAAAFDLIQRVRDRTERSLGPLLVAREGRADCSRLDATLGAWDGRFTRTRRRRLARHLDDCAVCEHRRRALLAPGGLVTVLPLIATPAALRRQVGAELGSGPDDPPPPPPAHEPSSWRADGFPGSD